MTEITVTEISKIVQGKLAGKKSAFNLPISKIITDSRTFYSGNNALFFALTGPRNNGHNFIPALVKKNVSAFVVSDETVICDDAAFILVDNTTSALQKLAAYHRQNFKYPCCWNYRK